jgi:hypothetical protein
MYLGFFSPYNGALKRNKVMPNLSPRFFVYFFRGLECVGGHFFAYVALFVFLRDVWIQTQRAAVASRLATNLTNHPSPLFEPRFIDTLVSQDQQVVISEKKLY